MYKKHAIAFCGILFCMALIVAKYPRQLGPEDHQLPESTPLPAPPAATGAQPAPAPDRVATAPETSGAETRESRPERPPSPAMETGSATPPSQPERPAMDVPLVLTRRSVEEGTKGFTIPPPLIRDPLTYVSREGLEPGERTALSLVRQIVAAQGDFKAGNLVDLNQNQVGEFGYLKELAGTEGLRDTFGLPRPGEQTSSWLESWAGNLDHRGVLTRDGYHFRIFLPDQEGRGLNESQLVYPSAVAAELAEKHWCLYAWPCTAGEGGRRAFFCNESGTVLTCTNTKAGYSGTGRMPAWNAAYPEWSNTMAATGCSDGYGRDGERWDRVD